MGARQIQTYALWHHLDFLVQVIFDFSIVNVGTVDNFSPKDVHDSLQMTF